MVKKTKFIIDKNLFSVIFKNSRAQIYNKFIVKP